MSLFAFAVWIGGWEPAYNVEKAAGRRPMAALWCALFWPASIGRHLAETLHRSDKDKPS